MSKSDNTSIIPVNQLEQKPYSTVVCYPRSTPEEIRIRIVALQQQGVTKVEFSGRTSVANVPVLGKGYVGVVVVAHVNGQRMALKMRRLDADRVDLTHEAEMLQKANSVGVGPRFFSVSNNFLLSQLVDGNLFGEWLENHKDKTLVRKVIVDILEQCWRLDEAGLDHGELSKAPKHLLVNLFDVPFIVDFETASVTRKVSNVTSVCQYLFGGNSQVPKMLAEVFGEKDRLAIISVLRDYKKNRSRERFEALIKVCI
jgi:putative serine/threonine protein kinase